MTNVLITACTWCRNIEHCIMEKYALEYNVRIQPLVLKARPPKWLRLLLGLGLSEQAMGW